MREQLTPMQDSSTTKKSAKSAAVQDWYNVSILAYLREKQIF